MVLALALVADFLLDTEEAPCKNKTDMEMFVLSGFVYTIYNMKIRMIPLRILGVTSTNILRKGPNLT